MITYNPPLDGLWSGDVQTFTEEEVAQTCEDAADYIRVHGWCQHSLYDLKGRACLFGALYFAQGLLIEDEDHFEYRDRFRRQCLVRAARCKVEDHLELVPRFPVIRLLRRSADKPAAVVWNDTAGRTEDEVVEALLHTAKGLRK